MIEPYDLSRLPDEVLIVILRQLAETAYLWEWNKARLVCRTWASILEPMLFARVDLMYGYGGNNNTRVGSFLNHLQRKPYLRDHVRELSLNVGKPDNWIYTQTRLILDLCTKIERLTLFYKLNDPDTPAIYNEAVHTNFWPVMDQISTLKLRELLLINVSYECILKTLTDAEIDHLILQWCGWSHNWTCPTASMSETFVDHPTASAYIDARERFNHRGRVRKLSVLHPMQSREAIDLLLLWPARLDHLYIQPSEP